MVGGRKKLSGRLEDIRTNPILNGKVIAGDLRNITPGSGRVAIKVGMATRRQRCGGHGLAPMAQSLGQIHGNTSRFMSTRQRTRCLTRLHPPHHVGFQ